MNKSKLIQKLARLPHYAALAVLSLAAGTAWADRLWTGAVDTDWSSAGNWDGSSGTYRFKGTGFAEKTNVTFTTKNEISDAVYIQNDKSNTYPVYFTRATEATADDVGISSTSTLQLAADGVADGSLVIESGTFSFTELDISHSSKNGSLKMTGGSFALTSESNESSRFGGSTGTATVDIESGTFTMESDLNLNANGTVIIGGGSGAALFKCGSSSNARWIKVKGNSKIILKSNGELNICRLQKDGGQLSMDFDGGKLSSYNNGNNKDNIIDNFSSGEFRVLAGGMVIDTAGCSTSITPALKSGVETGTDGGLTKQGNGTLTLSKTPTYNGKTTVSDGSLTIKFTEPLSTSTSALGELEVASGKTLTLDFSAIRPAPGSYTIFTSSILNGNTISTSYASNYTDVYDVALSIDSDATAAVKLNVSRKKPYWTGSSSSSWTDTGNWADAVATADAYFYEDEITGAKTVDMGDGGASISGALFLCAGNAEHPIVFQKNLTVSSKPLYIGCGDGSEGYLELQNGTFAFQNEFYLGGSGSSGTMVVDTGATAEFMNKDINIGNGGAATLTINGGTFKSGKGDKSSDAKYMKVNNATINLDAGELSIGSIRHNGGSPTINFNGGQLTQYGLTHDGQNLITSGSWALNVKSGGAKISVAEKPSSSNGESKEATIHQPLVSAADEDGGLEKLGTGTLVLAATPTYNGKTTVSDGALTIKPNVALSSTSPLLGELEVATDATLTVDLSAITPANGTYTLFSNATASDVTLSPGIANEEAYKFTKSQSDSAVVVLVEKYVASYGGEKYTTFQEAINAADNASAAYSEITVIDSTAALPNGFVIVNNVIVDNRTNSWKSTVAEGLWNNADNWEKGVVPAEYTAVTIPAYTGEGDTYIIRLTSNATSGDSANVCAALNVVGSPTFKRQTDESSATWVQLLVKGNITGSGTLTLVKAGLYNTTEGQVQISCPLVLNDNSADCRFSGASGRSWKISGALTINGHIKPDVTPVTVTGTASINAGAKIETRESASLTFEGKTTFNGSWTRENQAASLTFNEVEVAANTSIPNTQPTILAGTVTIDDNCTLTLPSSNITVDDASFVLAGTGSTLVDNTTSGDAGGKVSTSAANHVVVYSATTKTYSVAASAAATTGGKNYATLAEAITAAGENGTITLLANDSSETITLLAGQILNLNGFTITATPTASDSSTYAIGITTDSASHTIYTAISYATAQTWVGPADGDWSTYSNWNLGFVPNSSTAVTFNDGATATLSVDTYCGEVTVNGNVTISSSSGKLLYVKGNIVSGSGTPTLNLSNVCLKKDVAEMSVAPAVNFSNGAQIARNGSSTNGIVFNGAVSISGSFTIYDVAHTIAGNVTIAKDANIRVHNNINLSITGTTTIDNDFSVNDSNSANNKTGTLTLANISYTSGTVTLNAGSIIVTGTVTGAFKPATTVSEKAVRTAKSGTTTTYSLATLKTWSPADASTDSNWDMATNWSPLGVPGETDIVEFPSGGEYSVGLTGTGNNANKCGEIIVSGNTTFVRKTDDTWAYVKVKGDITGSATLTLSRASLWNDAGYKCNITCPLVFTAPDANDCWIGAPDSSAASWEFANSVKLESGKFVKFEKIPVTISGDFTIKGGNCKINNTIATTVTGTTILEGSFEKNESGDLTFNAVQVTGDAMLPSNNKIHLDGAVSIAAGKTLTLGENDTIGESAAFELLGEGSTLVVYDSMNVSSSRITKNVAGLEIVTSAGSTSGTTVYSLMNVDYVWGGTDGDWAVVANWKYNNGTEYVPANKVPDASNTAIIDGGEGTASVTIGSATTVGTLMPQNSVTLSSTSSGSLTVGNQLALGVGNRDDTLTLSGGVTFTTQGNLLLGAKDGAGSSNTSNNGTITINTGATLAVSQSGGTKEFIVGRRDYCTGTINVNGGTMTVGNGKDFMLGFGKANQSGYGKGVLNVTAGTMTSSQKLYIGGSGSASETYKPEGWGVVNVTGGTLQLNNDVYTARSNGSRAEINVGGGVSAASVTVASGKTLNLGNNPYTKDTTYYSLADASTMVTLGANGTLTAHTTVITNTAFVFNTASPSCSLGALTINGDVEVQLADDVTPAVGTTLISWSSLTANNGAKFKLVGEGANRISIIQDSDGLKVAAPVVSVTCGNVTTSYATVADALSAAAAGDTVTLLADYSTAVTLDKAVTLQMAAGKAYTGTITASAGEIVATGDALATAFAGATINVQAAGSVTIPAGIALTDLSVGDGGTVNVSGTITGTTVDANGTIGNGSTLFKLTADTPSLDTNIVHAVMLDRDVHFTLGDNGVYMAGAVYYWNNSTKSTSISLSDGNQSGYEYWYNAAGLRIVYSDIDRPTIFDTAVFDKKDAGAKFNMDVAYNILVKQDFTFYNYSAANTTYSIGNDVSATFTILSGATATLQPANGKNSLHINLYSKLQGCGILYAYQSSSESSYSGVEIYGDTSLFAGTVKMQVAKADSYNRISGEAATDNSNSTWLISTDGLATSGSGNRTPFNYSNSTTYKFGALSMVIASQTHASGNNGKNPTLIIGGKHVDSYISGTWGASISPTVTWTDSTATFTNAAANTATLNITGGGKAYVSSVPATIGFADNGGTLIIDDDNASVADDILGSMVYTAGTVGFDVASGITASATGRDTFSGASFKKSGYGTVSLTGAFTSIGTVTVTEGKLIISTTISSEQPLDYDTSDGTLWEVSEDKKTYTFYTAAVTYNDKSYSTIADAIAAAKAASDPAPAITLNVSSSENLTITPGVTLTIANGATYSGVLTVDVTGKAINDKVFSTDGEGTFNGTFVVADKDNDIYTVTLDGDTYKYKYVSSVYVWTGDDATSPTDWKTSANWRVDGSVPQSSPTANATVYFPSDATVSFSGTDSLGINKLAVDGALTLSTPDFAALTSGDRYGIQMKALSGSGKLVLSGANIANVEYSVVDTDLPIEVVGDTESCITGTRAKFVLRGAISGSGKIRFRGWKDGNGGVSVYGDNCGFSGTGIIDGDGNNNTCFYSKNSLSSSADWILEGKQFKNRIVFPDDGDNTVRFGSITTSVRANDGALFRININTTYVTTLEIGANGKDSAILQTLGDSGENKTCIHVRKIGDGVLSLYETRHSRGTEINGGTVVAQHENSFTSYDRNDNVISFGGGTLQYGTPDNGVTKVTKDWSARIKSSTSPISVYNDWDVSWDTALDSSNTGGITKKGAGTLTLTKKPLMTKPTITVQDSGTLVISNATALVAGTDFTCGDWTVCEETANKDDPNDSTKVTSYTYTFRMFSVTVSSSDSTEVTGTAVSVDGNWIAANMFSMTMEEASATLKSAAYADHASNGYSYLANYAMGLDPADATSKPVVAGAASSTDAGKIAIKMTGIKVPEGVTVTAKLQSCTTPDGTFTDVSGAGTGIATGTAEGVTETSAIEVDASAANPVIYYRLGVTFGGTVAP